MPEAFETWQVASAGPRRAAYSATQPARGDAIHEVADERDAGRQLALAGGCGDRVGRVAGADQVEVDGPGADASPQRDHSLHQLAVRVGVARGLEERAVQRSHRTLD